ncbi:MAG TPA: pilus assembly protein N-terminal domain-containing protein [Candidatus Acidoferrales bacterium]|nr:pilus assembly protein N-terminal domain-containing protein [Candidatus Acidoferrales bacterium]
MGNLSGFRSVRSFLAAILLALLLFVPSVEGAQQVPTITVTVNKSLVFGLAQKTRRVSVTQPEVAEVVVLSPNQLLINGKSVGSTSLILWPETGEPINYDLIVTADVGALRNQLRAMFPDEKIEVTTSAAAIVLRGEVSNEVVYDKVLEVVVNYLPPRPAPQVAAPTQTVSVRTAAEPRTATSGVAFAGGGQLAFVEEVSPTDVGRWPNKREIPGVIDLLTIREFNLIQLDVIVAEIQTSKARELGVDIAAIINGTTAILSRAGSQGGFPSQLLADPSTFPPTTTFGDAAGLALSHLGGTIQFTSVWRLFQNKDIAQILARPNLVIKNGRSGGFLAGGEFPVIRSTQETFDVEFKPFGVRLDFLPTLTWSKTIDLRVFPEVSDVDFSRTVQGIPSLSVRRTVTRVELQEGESLIIAGLLDRRVLKALTKFPFLGDIPILGTLFRSTRFSNNETELVIVITPKIVKAMKPGEKPVLPTIEKYDDPDIRQVPLPSRGPTGSPKQGPTIP